MNRREFLPSVFVPFIKVNEAHETRLAIVVGHNYKAAGAYSDWLGKSEYEFYSLFINHLIDKAKYFAGMDLKVFKRKPAGSYSSEIRQCYSNVDAWNPNLIFELHFNWGARAVGQTWTLFYHTSAKSRSLAYDIQYVTCEALSRTGQNDLVKPRYRHENGSYALRASKAPTLILEPTFAASEVKEAELLYEKQEKLAWAWLSGAHYWVSKNL